MNILRTIKLKKAKWIGHVLHKNCFLIHVLEERRDEKARKKT